MSSPFTPSEFAQRRRAEKARDLARWCYQRGIGPAVTSQQPQVLRAVARAAGISPPHVDEQGHSPTWHVAAELLHVRAGWDRAHGQPPPTHVPCIACAVLPAGCHRHRPAPAPVLCRGCRRPLDPVLAAAGVDLHPSCDDPAPTTTASTPSRR